MDSGPGARNMAYVTGSCHSLRVIWRGGETAPPPSRHVQPDGCVYPVDYRLHPTVGLRAITPGALRGDRS